MHLWVIFILFLAESPSLLKVRALGGDRSQEQSPYKRDPRESPHPFCLGRTQQRDSRLGTRKGALINIESAGALVLDLLVSRTVRNKCEVLPYSSPDGVRQA